MDENARRIYRLPPCPAYDIPGIESWLEDMAKDGWLVEKDGFFAGVMTFLQGKKQHVTYRLDVIQKNPSMWSEDGGEPDEEVIALSEEMGWEYVTKFREFYIYRSFEAQPRELHTDPAVQAMAMKVAKKRNISLILNHLASLLAIFIINFKDHSLRWLTLTTINIGTVNMVLITLFFGYVLLSPIPGILQLRKMQKQLETGAPISGRKDWKKGLIQRRLLELIPWVLGIAMIIGIGTRWAQDSEKHSIDVYTGAKHFVTIPEMAQGGEYHLSDFMDYGGYKAWSDVLAPVNVSWNEFGSFTTPEGAAYSGFLRIDYHETASAFIAENLVKDYLKHAENTGHHYSPMEAPESTLDFVALYQDIGRTVVIRQGNIVIRAQLGIDSSQTQEVPVELWIHLMEELFSKGGFF